MTAAMRERLAGVHAATIAPMRADFSIDEAALRAHLRSVAGAPGIRGLLVNGHAGENFVLEPDEKIRVIEIARETLGGDQLLCAGVNAESSLAAAREAEAAERAGADILLIFPPNSFALSHDRDAALLHQAHVLGACGLPVLLYGAPVGAGAMAYTPGQLLALAEDPRVVGVKEGSWESAAYEATWRLFRDRADFAVLGSGDEHLLAAYMIGSVGSQVSLAALAPGLLTALFAAAQAGDWAQARAVHERIYPLAHAIYRQPPGGRATVRLKAALAMLGAIPHAHARPPQPPATQAETDALRAALSASGLHASPPSS